MTVENGLRVQVSLPDFEGIAGLQTNSKGTWLSYAPNKGGRTTVGHSLSANGCSFRVLAVSRNDYTNGFITLQLQAVQ